MKQLKDTQRVNWIVFGVMFTLFAVKNLLFGRLAFGHWMAEDATTFWGVAAWLLPKLGSALALASLVWVLKDKRWMLIPALAVDIWCIANLIYMRNNNYLLDSFAFHIAGNLNGYWWSVLLFINLLGDLLIIFSSIAVWSLCWWARKGVRRPWVMVYCFLGAVALHYMSEGAYILSRPETERPAFRFDIATRESRERVYGIDYEYLVEETSLLSMPIYLLPDHIEIKHNKIYHRPLTAADSALITPHMATAEDGTLPNHPVILIILESWENWVLRDDVMPNLARLSRSEHVLYAERVKDQIIGAASADGQMIINTGIMPVSEGYTCFRYPHNRYPGLMHLTQDSAIFILPNDTSVWNQTEMSPAYGYDSTIVHDEADSLIFATLSRLQQEGWRHIQCKTQSTHAPFVAAKLSHMETPEDMPYFMSNYIKAFNATDAAMADFIHRIETDSVLRQYTILITGDHHIHYDHKRRQWARYAEKHGMDYRVTEEYQPVLIYSPRIEGNIHLTEPLWQMDIYPTLLHLLEADTYYWQGFGVNWLDAEAIQKRTTSAEEAARLSDLMLRNDWFRKQTAQ